MQAAKDRIGADGRFSTAIARIWTWVDEGTDRRIGNAGSERHMWASAIVMSDPGLEGEAQMGFRKWNQPIQTFPADRANHTLTNCVRLGTVRR
jgi:hypothetical protein